jgi:hypothetical protein
MLPYLQDSSCTDYHLKLSNVLTEYSSLEENDSKSVKAKIRMLMS